MRELCIRTPPDLTNEHAIMHRLHSVHFSTSTTNPMASPHLGSEQLQSSSDPLFLRSQVNFVA